MPDEPVKPVKIISDNITDYVEDELWEHYTKRKISEQEEGN